MFSFSACLIFFCWGIFNALRETKRDSGRQRERQREIERDRERPRETERERERERERDSVEAARMATMTFRAVTQRNVLLFSLFKFLCWVIFNA